MLKLLSKLKQSEKIVSVCLEFPQIGKAEKGGEKASSQWKSALVHRKIISFQLNSFIVWKKFFFISPFFSASTGRIGKWRVLLALPCGSQCRLDVHRMMMRERERKRALFAWEAKLESSSKAQSVKWDVKGRATSFVNVRRSGGEGGDGGRKKTEINEKSFQEIENCLFSVCAEP